MDSISWLWDLQFKCGPAQRVCRLHTSVIQGRWQPLSVQQLVSALGSHFCLELLGCYVLPSLVVALFCIIQQESCSVNDLCSTLAAHIPVNTYLFLWALSEPPVLASCLASVLSLVGGRKGTRGEQMVWGRSHRHPFGFCPCMHVPSLLSLPVMECMDDLWGPREERLPGKQSEKRDRSFQWLTFRERNLERIHPNWFDV